MECKVLLHCLQMSFLLRAEYSCFVCKGLLCCTQSTLILYAEYFRLLCCAQAPWLPVVSVRFWINDRKERCEWCTDLLYFILGLLDAAIWDDMYHLPNPPLPLPIRLCNAAHFWMDWPLLQNCTLLYSAPHHTCTDMYVHLYHTHTHTHTHTNTHTHMHTGMHTCMHTHMYKENTRHWTGV